MYDGSQGWDKDSEWKGEPIWNEIVGGGTGDGWAIVGGGWRGESEGGKWERGEGEVAEGGNGGRGDGLSEKRQELRWNSNCPKSILEAASNLVNVD